MTTDQWDKVYSQKGMAAYPDNMLVRFVAKHYYNAPSRKDVKFLDVGCGAGSSTWYLAREGFSAAAVDTSAVAMEKLRVRLSNEGLGAFMMCGDITLLEFKNDYFDCIIDISSLCYISEEKIQPLMVQLHKVLKPGGKFFSITPTFTCAKEPFNETVDGVKLNARFQTAEEASNHFKNFINVHFGIYAYEVKGHHEVRLWVIEAEKGNGLHR